MAGLLPFQTGETDVSKVVLTDSQLSHQEKNIQQTSQQCLKWTRTMHGSLARQKDQVPSPRWTAAHMHYGSSRRV